MIDGFKRLRKITKNEEESRKLLEAALDKDMFLNFISSYIDQDKILAEVDFSAFNERLSENEYQELNVEYHYPLLWESLQSVGFSSIDASSPYKWLSITYQAIKNDIIDPYYLAFDGKQKEGKLAIQEALNPSFKFSKIFKNDHNKNPVTHTSRAILRNMFGFIQEIGKKGIYREVPFAKAWWIIHLSNEISKQTNIDKVDLYNYFANNVSNYYELTLRMSSKLTIISDKNIRDGMFMHLIDKNVTNTNKFKNIIKEIGIESTWRSMGSLSPKENQKIIESLSV